ncbi:alpha/beta fold hydrolase [Xanthomonadaceae bacterium JHOS43]|nr:alpha/beta fold hydrolase [Xanthomonadaceae bacterium JHOS43]
MKRYAWLVALLLPTLAPARTLGDLSFTPCTLAPEGVLTSVAAHCATLEVPEDRSVPEGRRIALSIAWVAPEAGEAQPDPVFLLAGGPGQSARESYPSVAPAFKDIVRYRNVILLDQRGTGESNRLACDSDTDDMLDDSPEAITRHARDCLEALSTHADVRHYTTTDAVADLDAVRRAIGAATINLIGISYGTRVAQQYMKAHPATVRSVVLDGVVPNTLVLGQEHAKNLDAALATQFRHCAMLASCSEAMGDLQATFRQLATELREAPRKVRYRDATTGKMMEGDFSYAMLAALLRLYAYHPATAATLPVLLHELAQGETDAAMAQAMMLLSSMGDSMAHGMGLSVSCSEDADELRPDPEDAGRVLGSEFITSLKAQCNVWPRGQRPDDMREPVRGDIPVLLLSGLFDPVTPPRYGDEVAETLSKARHLILHGQGHNVIGVGCTPKLVAQFIESTDPAGLDAACLERLSTLQPFTGHHGWEP